MPNCRVVRGDDEIAGERDLETAGERIALDGRDQRLLRGPFDEAGEAAALELDPLAAQKGLKIHSGAEVSAGAGENPNRQRRVSVETINRRCDRLGGGAVDGVARLWPIDRDDDDAAFNLDQRERLGHCLAPFSKAARSPARSRMMRPPSTRPSATRNMPLT